MNGKTINPYNSFTKAAPVSVVAFYMWSLFFSFCSGVVFGFPILLKHSLPLAKSYNDLGLSILLILFYTSMSFITMNFVQMLLLKGSVDDLKIIDRKILARMTYMWTLSQLIFVIVFVLGWTFDNYLQNKTYIIFSTIVILYFGLMRVLFMFREISVKLRKATLPGSEILLCLDMWFVLYLLVNRFFH